MSSIVHTMAFGSGTGTQLYNPDNISGVWNLTLDWTPTPGNTLILALALPGSQIIDFISYGETGLDLGYAQGPIFVFTCTVPEYPGSTIGAIGEVFNCPGFVQEVSGISDNTPDRKSNGSGGPTTSYDTGSTLTTRNASEYWLNVYAYYNASTGADCQGSAPSNGYTLNYGGSPITGTMAGWVPTIEYSAAAPTYSYGMVFAHKFVSCEANAGGTITDSNENENYYAAGAITWATSS